MKLSVIIPSYNESDVVITCVESLRLQKLRDFEIVIIDDGSTDGTLDILKNLKKNVTGFNFARQNHKGAGSARNYGAKLAKGEILIFVDADMTFDPEFLENLTDPIKKGKSKGTFSKEEYVLNWENVWARCWNIEEGWEEKRRHPKNYPDTQPVFRAILKEEFNRVGGYTPGGYDDDWTLSKKLGYMAQSAPGAIFYHKNPATLREIFNQAKWVGKRKYKFGFLGTLYALTRSSLPVSLVKGVYKSVKFKTPAFIVFKIVYDLGLFFGILNYLITGNTSK